MANKVNGLDIKIARLKAGLRQYDLAARLGIPPSRLSEIESGRREPSREVLERILRVIKPDIRTSKCYYNVPETDSAPKN